LWNIIYPMSAYGICFSENEYPSIETTDRNWWNNLGAFPWLWPNGDVTAYINPSEYTKMDDKKTYYACVYFKNMFGTFYSKAVELGKDWVEINGVKWARRNLDAPGTFVAKPEDWGMLYQWNRKIAWPGLVELTGWDTTIPTGNTWEKGNDPCPKGWRVPASEDIEKLVDETKVTNEWTICGRKFTDKTTGASLFLPAAGHRDVYDGRGLHFSACFDVSEQSGNGYYWSSTPYTGPGYYYPPNSHFANGLYFTSHQAAYHGRNYRVLGQSVRCVVE